MKSRLGLPAAAVFALALFALWPARSEAGESYGPYPSSCGKNADGSGYCLGTIAGFRASSDTTAWAAFNVNTSGSISAGLSAGYSGKYFNCYTYNAPLVARISQLTTDNVVFYLAWDATGVCNYIATWVMSEWN